MATLAGGSLGRIFRQRLGGAPELPPRGVSGRESSCQGPGSAAAGRPGGGWESWDEPCRGCGPWGPRGKGISGPSSSVPTACATRGPAGAPPPISSIVAGLRACSQDGTPALSLPLLATAKASMAKVLHQPQGLIWLVPFGCFSSGQLWGAFPKPWVWPVGGGCGGEGAQQDGGQRICPPKEPFSPGELTSGEHL